MGPAPGRAIGAATQHAHTHLGGQVLEGAQNWLHKMSKNPNAPPNTTICLCAAAIVAAIGDCSRCFLFVVFFLCLPFLICRTQQNHRYRHPHFPCRTQQATRGFWPGVHGVLFRRKFFDDEIFNFKGFSPHCQATQRRRGLHQGHCSEGHRWIHISSFCVIENDVMKRDK